MNFLSTPKNVFLDITTGCNLRCRYCYYFGSPGAVPEDLPTEEWLVFFEELTRNSVLDVTLAGGEPFIRRDFTTLIDGIVRNRMRFQILSNGTLIDGETAAYIANTGRCNHVQVSIDGPAPEPHDAFRGSGSFNKAIAGIQTLMEHHIRVAVRVTIHRENVRYLDDIAYFLLEEMGLKSFSTNSAACLGLVKGDRGKVQLSVEERQSAMETLFRLHQKYNGRIKANAGPLKEAFLWKDMEESRKERRPIGPGKGHLNGCGGVMNKMAVRADGVMVPCNMLGHIELGHINRDDLKTVWQTHPELKRLRERKRVSLKDLPYCEDCPYNSYCTGSCPATAYSITGRDSRPDPDACLRKFIEDGGSLAGLLQ